MSDAREASIEALRVATRDNLEAMGRAILAGKGTATHDVLMSLVRLNHVLMEAERLEYEQGPADRLPSLAQAVQRRMALGRELEAAAADGDMKRIRQAVELWSAGRERPG